MIQMPRRSVTRFFIPLIDVLTLLFCIFLLMPLVKAPAQVPEEGPSRPPEQGSEGQRPDSNPARKEGDETPEERARLLQQRLTVRVLEIDPVTGKLFYNDPERTELRNEADAHALIERDRRATAGGGRDLYYLILYPRDPNSPFPLASRKRTYDNWLKGVPHGWDIPGDLLKGGRPS
jgi:hypothetical protein